MTDNLKTCGQCKGLFFNRLGDFCPICEGGYLLTDVTKRFLNFVATPVDVPQAPTSKPCPIPACHGGTVPDGTTARKDCSECRPKVPRDPDTIPLDPSMVGLGDPNPGPDPDQKTPQDASQAPSGGDLVKGLGDCGRCFNLISYRYFPEGPYRPPEFLFECLAGRFNRADNVPYMVDCPKFKLEGG